MSEVEIPPRGTRGRRIPRFLIRILNPVYPQVAQRTMSGTVTLTTVGARSGKRRATPVRGFAESDGGWLIVASFAGAASHRAWFFNLAKHPDQVWIRVDGRDVQVRPRTLAGEEERPWNRIVEAAPGFRGYQEATDREIPVIRLTPTA